MGVVTEETLNWTLSERLRVPYVDLEDDGVDCDLIRPIPEELLRRPPGRPGPARRQRADGDPRASDELPGGRSSWRCRRGRGSPPPWRHGTSFVTSSTRRSRGSGKSTTLAAMIDLVNRTTTKPIIALEDPIEFVHVSKSCLVNQREVGPHTRSFASARRAALREDPDVIRVGRDAGPGDDRPGAHRGRDRSPRLRDAPHQERAQDDRPYHRRVPARPAAAGPTAGQRPPTSGRRTGTSRSAILACPVSFGCRPSPESSGTTPSRMSSIRVAPSSRARALRSAR